MIKKLIIPAIISVSFLYACSGGGGNANPSKYTGKWQATSFESPSDDSMLNVQMQSMMTQIDGLTAVDKEMEKQFKTNNLDSVKVKWRALVNEQKAQIESDRKKEVENFKIEIKSDGYVLKKMENKNDSAAWYTTTAMGKELLFMDPALIDKPGDILTFQVAHVGSDSMRLKLHRMAGVNMYINLKKVK